MTFKLKWWLINCYNLKSLYVACFLWNGTNSTFPFMQLHMLACIHHFFRKHSCTTAFKNIYLFSFAMEMIGNHPLSSIPLLTQCSSLLSCRSACRCQECKVVEPEGATALLSCQMRPRRRKMMFRRVKWVGCVILTCRSVMLYNLSSVECLYSCFYEVECLEVSI